MEKMGWRAQQGVACLLNRHWSLVLAFSFMNVSESGTRSFEWAAAGAVALRRGNSFWWP